MFVVLWAALQAHRANRWFEPWGQPPVSQPWFSQAASGWSGLIFGVVRAEGPTVPAPARGVKTPTGKPGQMGIMHDSVTTWQEYARPPGLLNFDGASSLDPC